MPEASPFLVMTTKNLSKHHQVFSGRGASEGPKSFQLRVTALAYMLWSLLPGVAWVWKQLICKSLTGNWSTCPSHFQFGIYLKLLLLPSTQKVLIHVACFSWLAATQASCGRMMAQRFWKLILYVPQWGQFISMSSIFSCKSKIIFI